MKKIIFVIFFLEAGINGWSQKSSFGVGFSSYNHINDRYGYKFNQFSKVFWSGYNNPSGVIYMGLHFHLFYEYKLDSLYKLRIANDLFTREYRNQKDFLEDEIGLEGRVFSTTVLSLNRVLLSRWEKKIKLIGICGLAYRKGDEYFHTGKINNKPSSYTADLNDLGYVIGGEARYNFFNFFFVNGNLNFIDYVIGSKEPPRISIYNKNWTVFQANFSVGVNF
jgi:hypothetical protein